MTQIKTIILGRLISYVDDPVLVVKIISFDYTKGEWLCLQHNKWNGVDIGYRYIFNEDFIKTKFRYVKQSKSHLPKWF